MVAILSGELWNIFFKREPVKAKSENFKKAIYKAVFKKSYGFCTQTSFFVLRLAQVEF